jgi:general transcription factor IIIA
MSWQTLIFAGHEKVWMDHSKCGPHPRCSESPNMSTDSDDDYERISDFDMSESEDEREHESNHDTTVTTPQTPRSLRPSELKTILCPYDDCFKTFNRRARLNEHLRSHTNIRPFKCPHLPCTKDFLRDSHLKRHIKSAHSQVRDYTCTWEGCSKSFATGTRLRRHEAAHEGKEKYRCRGYEGCNETFRKHDTLARHIISFHEQMRPFPCPNVDLKTGEQCTQGFETAEKLRAHQKAKHDNTRFACKTCLDQQNSSIDTEVTINAIPSLFPYFATYADLQSHVASVHPPTCSFCPTSFTTVKELTRHLELQHSIVDPDAHASKPMYPCTYPNCSRSFAKRGNLNVHVKTVHEYRRDFICGQREVTLPEEAGPISQLYGCGRGFTSKASLEEHIRTAHLGLGSRRMEREKKRKAEKEDAAGYTENTARKRKPRKDKGVKKISALASLLTSGPSQTEQARDQVYNDHEEDHENGQYLTGSMTMYGSQIYHHDSGLYDTGPITIPQSYFKTEELDENVFHSKSYDNDDDFIFDGFEQDGPPIDPVLLHD